jgi:MFS family permease
MARLLVMGALGRLPTAMDYIALVLFIRGIGEAYALAGAVTAVYTVGYAIMAPVQGRLADRYGATRVLWPLAIAHCAAMAALVLAGLGGVPAGVLIVLGFLGGATSPPTGAIVRKVLTRMGAQRRDLLPTIFALDSIFIDLIYIGGPAITAVVIAVASPAAALITGCLITVISVAGLAGIPALAQRTQAEAHGRGGALRSRGFRTVLGCAMALGVAYGSIQVSMVGFADDIDAGWSAPWLLASLSVGGVLAVLIYGAHGHRFTSSKGLVCASCLLPVAFAPLIFASSVAQMAVFALLAGTVLSPVFALTNQIVGEVAPANAVTEAYSWSFMAILVGGSIGLTIGGKLIDLSSWHVSLMLTVAAAIVMALVVITRRRTLPSFTLEKVSPEAA